MKKSGYLSTFHIYTIFFILLLFMIASSIGIIFNFFTIQKSSDELVLTKWPKEFTQQFPQYVSFTEGKLQISDTGMEKLAENNIWFQIINEEGTEVLSYKTPTDTLKQYTSSEIISLYQTSSEGVSSIFVGTIHYEDERWIYMLGFPVQIFKLTTYLNGNRFTNGKSIFIYFMGLSVLLIIIFGLIYGFFITKKMSYLINSVEKIASRSYIPIEAKGIFKDIHNSLNLLYIVIRRTDEMRAKTEKVREEWIANITHDLKTPLSPIKGYAELIANTGSSTTLEELRRYGAIIQKNTSYAEELINDLKLVYQLKNEMIPINRQDHNFVRFIKEIIIDILNHPEYETRDISFYSGNENIILLFDQMLLKRAINNLIYNSLIHNNNNKTKIDITVKEKKNKIHVSISDNGKGMNEEALVNLFSRYYRGTNNEDTPEGTGLGMAIAKEIIALHEGSLYVKSKVGVGTSFFLELPLSN